MTEKDASHFLATDVGATHIRGMSTILNYDGSGVFWEEWNRFIGECKHKGLTVGGIDPAFYVQKLLELQHEVFNPK